MKFIDVLIGLSEGKRFYREAWTERLPKTTQLPSDTGQMAIRFFVEQYKISEKQKLLIAVSPVTGEITNFSPTKSSMIDNEGDYFATDWEEYKQ